VARRSKAAAVGRNGSVPRRHTSPPPPGPAVAPAAEPLERRLLMANISSTAGGGLWNAASTWVGMVVPTGSDNVTIIPGSHVEVSDQESANSLLTQQGSYLTIDASTTAHAVSLSVDSTSGGGNITNIGGFFEIDGPFLPPSGTINVTGTTNLNATGYIRGGTVDNIGLMNVATGADINGTNLDNDGTVNLNGQLVIGNANFVNEPDGKVNVTSAAGFGLDPYDPAGNNLITNMGTWTQTAAGTFTVNASLNFYEDGGTFNLDAGNFSMAGSGNLRGCTLNIATGSTFSFDGPSNAGNDLADNIVGAGGGTVAFNTGYFDGTIPGGSGVAEGATLNFPDGMAQVTGAEFDAYNTAYISNAGFLDYVGSAAHGTLSMRNDGTIRNLSSTAIPITHFYNDAAGVLDLTTDFGLTGGEVDNAGTIRKSAGTGTSLLDVGIFDNTGGTFDVRTGTVGVTSEFTGVYIAGAPISVATGATFDVEGTLNLSGTLSSTGGGAVTITTGTIQSPSQYDAADGTAPAVLNFAAGTLLDLGGVIQNGNNGVTNTGTIDFRGTTDFGSLTNQGLLSFDAGPIDLAGTWLNDTAGVVDFTADTTDGVVTQNGVLTNKGTIIKSGGTGTLAFTNAGALDNQGTIEAASGTIQLSYNDRYTFGYDAHNNRRVVPGQTLKVDAGAAITTDQPLDLTTIDGTVILDGPGASFPDIADANLIDGTLAVLDGASFATTGSLTNAGTLRVGGPFTVNGDLVEDASAGTPVLDIAVGAAPGPSAPDLTVVGATTLAGNLTAEFTGGFGATVGTAYPAATFTTAATGAFADTTGVGPAFTVAVGPTTIVLNVMAAASSDLDLTAVHAPTAATPGQPATFTWDVTNNAAAAAGPWDDSVYLSPDGTVTNAGAILLGRVAHTGGLAAGASYTGTLTAAYPSVAAGYQVVVVVDSRLAVSDTNRANNVGSSAEVNASLPSLAIGTTTSGTISDQQDVLYKLALTAGQTAVLTSTFAVVAEAEVYVSFAAIPSAVAYDEAATDVSQTTRTTVIRATQSGDYYVLVHGREGAAGAAQPFTLTPTLSTFGVTGLSVTSGGNAGPVTTQVSGYGFTGATSVSLVMGSTTVAASSVRYVNAGTLFATFDLTGQPTGAYDLDAADASAAATVASAFTVTAGTAATTAAGITFDLSVPTHSRGDLATRAVLTYTNTTANDLPAPYFFISGEDNTEFRLPAQADYSAGSIELVGISATGPAGTLAPGATETQTILYRQVAPTGHVSGTVSATEVDPADVVDLSALQADLQPAGEPADAWAAVFGNFLAAVGTTVGGLSGVLDNAATALSVQGTYTGDPAALMGYALQRAGDNGQIAARYTVSPFGRGQTDAFTTIATTDSAGDVSIQSGGLQRAFAKQPDGTYVGGANDTGSLTLAGGVYALREATGATTVFNADGTLNDYQDATGNRLTANYTTGLLTSLVSTDGDTYSFAYDSAGLVSQVTDPEGRVTTYTHDPVSQTLDSITTTTGTTTFGYYSGAVAADQYAITSIGYADGTHRYYTYDSQGRLASQSRDGGAETTTYSYDASGTATATDPLGNVTRVTTDANGAIASVEDGLGDIARIAYDPAGRPTSQTSPGGFATTTTYDASGRPTTARDASGGTTNYAYDPTLNSLLSLTDADGDKTTYTYDAAGDVTGVTDAAGQSTAYTYDAQGRLASVANPNATGQTVTYNAIGLVTSRTYSDGSTVGFTYDGHRNLLTATDSVTGTVTYTYNAADQLTSVTYPGGASLAYTYDASGRLTAKTDQTGFVTNYSYDALGELSQLTNAAGAVITTYTYDAAGNLTAVANANGSTTTYTYDANGNATSIVNEGPGATIDSTFTYTVDSDGRRTSMVSAAGTTTYGYDPDGQLTTVTLPGGRTITYAYDAAGNRTTVNDSATGPVTYTTNGTDEYTVVGGTTYGYDDDGNLISSTTAGVTTTYAYDARNELATVTTPTHTIAYTYDGVGDRIASTDNGVTTEDLVDPTNNSSIAGTYTAAGAVVDHYVYGVGLTGSVDSTGAASYYGFDGSGNTADITNAAGAVSSSYTYLPFGAILSSTGAANSPFTFGGQYGIQSTSAGLCATAARFYDPNTGRFTQRDPIGTSGGINLYQYASNNPVSLVDPVGTNPFLANAAETLAYFAEHGYYPLTIAENLSAINTARTAAQTFAALDGAAAIGYVSPNLPAVYVPPFPELPPAVAGTGTTGIATGAGGEGLAVAGGEGLGVVGAEGLGIAGARGLAVAGGPVVVAAVTILTKAPAVGQGLAILDDKFSNTVQNAYSNPFTSTLTYATNNAALNNALHKPLSQELIDNLHKQGLEPSEDDLRFFIELDADLVRARNRGKSPTETKPTNFLTAFDPNDIIGPAGYGTAGFVPPGEVLPYTVTFENKSTATAPAQVVTVTEQLSGNLDWSTFALGDMGFGANAVTVPAGLASYATSVAVGATLRVDIAAALDRTTGVVTWTFTSIDPTTGDQVSAASAGFLPPDDAAGDGAGYVTYSVQAKSGLATGTPIGAQATIVFDGNAPIATPAIVNTIDAVAPTSTVAPLPATAASTYVPLAWSGQDDAGGSGIASYSIYVSVDGAAFAPWLVGTTATSGEYPAAPGHTYGFYSSADDGAGNVEPAAAAAQATTMVPAVARTLTVTAGHPAKFTDAAGAAETVTLTGPGSGALSFLTATGNADPVSFVLTGTTAATRVSVRAAGKAGTSTLTDVSATGSLGSFTAATTDLLGTFAVAGTLASLSLDNAPNGAVVSVGGAGVATAFRFGTLHDVSLTTAAAIKSLSVATWTDGPAAADAVSAPSVASLTVAGNFDPTVTLSTAALALGSANIRGSVSGGSWTTPGSLGTLSVRGNDAGSITSASVRSLRVGGNLSAATLNLTGTQGIDLATLAVTGTVSDSSILSAASIGAATVGGMSGSELFAGVVAGSVGLPTVASALTAGVGIRSFIDLGRTPFAASDVAAYTLGSASLRDVTTDDGGTIFGVAAHAYGSFTLTQPKAKPVRYPGSKLKATLSNLGGDLRIAVV
jgi:RHS repeat-associated protein